MGKRRGGKKTVVQSGKVNTTLTLREEASGKSRPKDGKSMLKLNHLQRLAEWSSGEASIPSLAAFFGHRFAEFGEFLGLPPDRSLFPCQRCETLLRPNINCNVRTEKNRSKKRRCGNETKPPTLYSTVYTCNFCSHRNLKPLRQKEKPCLKKPKPRDSATVQEQKTETKKAETPTTGLKLLDSKKRIRKKAGVKGSIDEVVVNSGAEEGEKGGGMSRKRKKSWTSLKEIAVNEEQERNQRFNNISIPFKL